MKKRVSRGKKKERKGKERKGIKQGSSKQHGNLVWYN
jgi:hypothetical protein